MNVLEVPRQHERRYLVLLAFLAVLLTASPIAESSGSGRIAFHAVFQLTLLSGLLSFPRPSGWLSLGAALLLPTVALFWLQLLGPPSLELGGPVGLAISHLALTGYLLLLVLNVLRDLFSSTTVTTDRLCGGVSAYLLIGLAFGALFTGLESFVPGSFESVDGVRPVHIADSPGAVHPSGLLFYASFVTLTTLGYGDVTPRGPVAQMLCLWESIIGQVYLTVLVARLVGLHVAAASAAPETDPAKGSPAEDSRSAT